MLKNLFLLTAVCIFLAAPGMASAQANRPSEAKTTMLMFRMPGHRQIRCGPEGRHTVVDHPAFNNNPHAIIFGRFEDILPSGHKISSSDDATIHYLARRDEAHFFVMDDCPLNRWIFENGYRGVFSSLLIMGTVE